MFFQEHVYEKLKDAILGWDDILVREIYAISFFIYDEDDDPRHPALTLGYNTEGHWRTSITQASSESEAKWNYAFWPQTIETLIGDASDVLLREGWIKSMGFWYSDEDEDRDFDRTMELGERITQEFVEMAIGISQRLHDDGIITAKFGKVLPILVHELEYYDAIARQNERANPNGSASEFIYWVDSGCE